MPHNKILLIAMVAIVASLAYAPTVQAATTSDGTECTFHTTGAGTLAGETYEAGVYCYNGAINIAETITIDTTDGDVTFYSSAAFTQAVNTEVVKVGTGDILWDIYGTVFIDANTVLRGDVQSNTSSVTLGANSEILGNTTAASSIIVGAQSIITGNMTAGSYVDLGASSTINGDVDSGSYVRLGASSTINGDVDSGSSVTLGEYSTINGCAIAASSITLTDNATINGCAIAGTSITLGLNSTITGDATAGITSTASYTATRSKNGDTQTITVTFGEAVTGTPTIALSGAKTVSDTAMTDSGDQIIWTYAAGTTWTGDGTVTVTVGTATDAMGNPVNSTPSSNTFTVDNTGPTVAITSSPATGATVSSTTLSYTVTFNESVSDFTSTDITVTGTANGGSPVVSSFAGSGTTYTFDVLKGSSDGTAVVRVESTVATDALTNTNSASNTYTLTIDQTAPITPTFTSAVPEPSTEPTKVFTGTGDNGSTIKIKSSQNGVVGEAVVVDGTWSITTSILKHGVHNMVTTSTDAAGNESSLSSVQVIRIVTQVPASTIGVILNPAGSEIAIKWIAGDNRDTVDDYRIHYKFFESEQEWFTYDDGISTQNNAIVMGLTDEQKYSFKITAHNLKGWGANSTKGWSTPSLMPDDPRAIGTFNGTQTFDDKTIVDGMATFNNKMTWGKKIIFNESVTFTAPQEFGQETKFGNAQDWTKGTLDHNMTATSLYFGANNIFPDGAVTGNDGDFSKGIQTFGSNTTFGIVSNFADQQNWGTDEQNFNKYMHFGKLNNFTQTIQDFKTGTTFGDGTEFKDGQSIPKDTVPSFGLLLSPVTCGTDTASKTCQPTDNSKFLSPGEFIVPGIDPADIKSSVSIHDKSFAIEGLGLEMSFGSIDAPGTIISDFYDPAKIPASTSVGNTGKVTMTTSNGNTAETVGSIMNISTGTATISGDITITIPYDENNIPQGKTESELTLLHYVNNVWITESNCTTDTTKNRITCIVTSLSPFGVGSTSGSGGGGSGGGGSGGGGSGGGGSGGTHYSSGEGIHIFDGFDDNGSPIYVDIEKSTPEIKDWVKQHYELWKSGIIDDATFRDGITYLSTEGVIKVSTLPELLESGTEIPYGFEYMADQWYEDTMPETNFINYLSSLFDLKLWGDG